MAHLNSRAASRIAAAAVSLITLCAGGSFVAAPAVSAASDLPLQPQCGPDPLTLIDPCEMQPPPGVGGAPSGPATAIPWDLVDSVLFG
jgi:hypothetical protein